MSFWWQFLLPHSNLSLMSCHCLPSPLPQYTQGNTIKLNNHRHLIDPNVINSAKWYIKKFVICILYVAHTRESTRNANPHEKLSIKKRKKQHMYVEGQWYCERERARDRAHAQYKLYGTHMPHSLWAQRQNRQTTKKESSQTCTADYWFSVCVCVCCVLYSFSISIPVWWSAMAFMCLLLISLSCSLTRFLSQAQSQMHTRFGRVLIAIDHCGRVVCMWQQQWWRPEFVFVAQSSGCTRHG